jgi:hypothetical protein
MVLSYNKQTKIISQMLIMKTKLKEEVEEKLES